MDATCCRSTPPTEQRSERKLKALSPTNPKYRLRTGRRRLDRLRRIGWWHSANWNHHRNGQLWCSFLDCPEQGNRPWLADCRTPPTSKSFARMLCEKNWQASHNAV